MNVFENEGVEPGELRLVYPYWEHATPLTFEVKGSYADRDAEVGDQAEHRWDHGLGEIVTALIDAGLRDHGPGRAPVPRLEGRLPRRGRGRQVPACRRARPASCR